MLFPLLHCVQVPLNIFKLWRTPNIRPANSLPLNWVLQLAGNYTNSGEGHPQACWIFGGERFLKKPNLLVSLKEWVQNPCILQWFYKATPEKMRHVCAQMLQHIQGERFGKQVPRNSVSVRIPRILFCPRFLIRI